MEPLPAVRKCLLPGEYAQSRVPIPLSGSPSSPLAPAAIGSAGNDCLAGWRRGAHRDYPLQSGQGELTTFFIFLTYRAGPGLCFVPTYCRYPSSRPLRSWIDRIPKRSADCTLQIKDGSSLAQGTNTKACSSHQTAKTRTPPLILKRSASILDPQTRPPLPSHTLLFHRSIFQLKHPRPSTLSMWGMKVDPRSRVNVTDSTVKSMRFFASTRVAE
jgi:hypothetical protein